MRLDLNQKTFIRGYVIAALWSSTDTDPRTLADNEFGEGESVELDSWEGPISLSALKQMHRESVKFLSQAKLDELDNMGQAGHDFWLTRNHHGAGFWDREDCVYGGQAKNEELTTLAHSFGSCDLYIGDDLRIYAQ